jgi:hypothetical protein
MAFRNFWFRAAYAGPGTMTRRIIPTGTTPEIRLDWRIVGEVDIGLRNQNSLEVL